MAGRRSDAICRSVVDLIVATAAIARDPEPANCDGACRARLCAAAGLGVGLAPIYAAYRLLDAGSCARRALGPTRVSQSRRLELEERNRGFDMSPIAQETRSDDTVGLFFRDPSGIKIVFDSDLPYLAGSREPFGKNHKDACLLNKNATADIVVLRTSSV